MFTTSRAANDALIAKRAALEALFTEARDGNSYDFSRVTSLPGKSALDIVDHVQALNAELNDIASIYDRLAAAEALAKDSEADHARRPMQHGTTDTTPKAHPSLREAIANHPAFKRWQNRDMEPKIIIDEWRPDVGLKAVFSTTAGWAPEVLRTGEVIGKITRPIQLLDIIPTFPTSQTAIKWMLETVRTSAAAEVAEAGTYPEDTYTVTEQSTPVQKVASAVPATDEELADVAQGSGYLTDRLQFGLRQRLDGQVLNGNGTAPNLRGLLNVVGIQTTARDAVGNEPSEDAFFRAGRLIRVTGRATPTHILIHPTNWEAIRLRKESTGAYIWGPPTEQGPERMWGYTVVQTDHLTAGVGLVGDFGPAAYAALFMRADIALQFTNSHAAEFMSGIQRIRAELRAAFRVTRPEAFATVTALL